MTNDAYEPASETVSTPTDYPLQRTRRSSSIVEPRSVPSSPIAGVPDTCMGPAT